jgi:hypothetical protein
VPSFVADLQQGLRQGKVLSALAAHDTPALFSWLMELLSFQGIADRVAAGFIRAHGNVAWSDIERALATAPACPKLTGYWRFDDCGYQKITASCCQPELLPTCPLPAHRLRNGHLNQLAYSLFLFIRDVADGDIVAWIENQMASVNPRAPGAVDAAREALISPLRHVYGVSDKVAAMALSILLIGAGRRRPFWLEVGASCVVIDTLVHNFLHRTGILGRLQADHPYGPRCYRPGGCADVVRAIADGIDVRAYNPTFPAVFPRFVQHTIWRYCAENALNICNGNRINDAAACDNRYCRLHAACDRISLRQKST